MRIWQALAIESGAEWITNDRDEYSALPRSALARSPPRWLNRDGPHPRYTARPATTSAFGRRSSAEGETDSFVERPPPPTITSSRSMTRSSM